MAQQRMRDPVAAGYLFGVELRFLVDRAAERVEQHALNGVALANLRILGDVTTFARWSSCTRAVPITCAAIPGLLALAASENCGHDAGAAPPAHESHNPQGLFVRGVGNEEFSHDNETQRTACEVGAPVTLLRKSDKGLYSGVNLLHHAMRGFGAVLPNVCGQLVYIFKSFWVEIVAAHARPVRRASILSCNRAKASSPGMSFTFPLLTSS